jgi:hypothetical protein
MRDLMARVAVVLGIMACAQASQTPTHDPAADKAAVDAVRNAEMAALNSGNIDSIMAVYDTDVDMMAPRSPHRSWRGGRARHAHWHDEGHDALGIVHVLNGGGVRRP